MSAVPKSRIETQVEREITLTDTDIANAKRLARRHGANIKYVREGKWLVHDGRRWRFDDKTVQVQAFGKETAEAIYDEIKGAANETAMLAHARRSRSKKAIDNMIALCRDEAGVYCELADFDEDLMLLNVGNGTLDLRTGGLRPHSRDDLLTKITDVDYDENADCVLWDRFLWRVTGGNKELYKYLQRLVGYLLTGQTTEQVLHFLFGLGANGKSVFCEIIAALLGDYAAILSPDMLMVKKHTGIPNDIARLRGVRVALMNETSQGARFDEAKLKDLTGSDSLTGRFLHCEFFDFIPTHKLIIRGNHKPAISGTDEGIWRRLRLVPFTVAIPPDEQDKSLLAKLRAELPGILKWSVQGCLEWQRIGLDPPSIITNAVNEYRAESDTLGKFIAEHCETRKLAQVKSGAFFDRYQQFSEQVGERWMPSKDLPHEMHRRGFEWKRTKTGGMFFGIELRGSDGQVWDEK